MADTPAAEAPPSRESLFPPGSPGTPEYNGTWDNIEDVTEASQTDQPSEATDVDDGEVQTEGHEDEPESGDETSEATSETMRAYDFAKQAGWKLDDFYAGVTVPIDGSEVTLSKVIDDAKSLRSTNDALSRERDELQSRLNQASTSMPAAMPPVSPEVQKLLVQAELHEQALLEGNWQGMDSGDASQQQIFLMTKANQLRAEAQQKALEHQAKMQEQFAKVREEAEKQVRQLIPAWSDSKVRTQDERANRDFVKNFGFKPEEYDNALDPRMRHLVNFARQQASQVEKVKTKAKAVRKVSKVLPPGSRQGEQRVSLEDSKRKISDAKSQSEKQRLRLTLPLGD